VLAETENAELRELVADLQKRVASLEMQIGAIDELEWDDALAKARDFFAEPRTADAADVAEAIGTSVTQAVDLLAALEAEGAIAIKG